MFSFLLAEPVLLLGAFLCGMLFKRLIVDKLRSYVIRKVAPGIIKKYLEEALGINQDVLPAVKITAIPPTPVADPVVAPVVAAEVVA